MTNAFYDETVIPSYLSSEPRGGHSGSDDNLVNGMLRYGEVRDIVYPKDKRSFSGTEIEYEIEVAHRDGTGISTSTIYRGVMASDVFGGVGDRVQYTYRKDSKASKDGLGNGSKVLILCISGDQQKAIIIGGKSVRSTKATDVGHHLDFEFNGAQFKVNKDGEIQILFRGATDSEGKLLDGVDKDFSNSFVRFDMEGSIILQDAAGQVFKIQNTFGDEQVLLEATKLVVNTEDTVELTAKTNVFIDAVDGGISLTSTNGTDIGRATDYMMLGTTYRRAEGSCHQQMSKAFTIGQIAAIAAQAALQAAAPLNAIPMVGGILAMPFLITASTQMGVMAQAFSTAQTALDTMESNSQTFLSSLNKLD